MDQIDESRFATHYYHRRYNLETSFRGLMRESISRGFSQGWDLFMLQANLVRLDEWTR